jgi:hypothetical protein
MITTITILIKNNLIVNDVTPQQIQDVQKYKEQEKQKQIIENTLRNIKTKQILTQELQKTQKINLLKGELTYENVVPKQAWLSWFNNQMDIRLTFTYMTLYDIKNIEILSVDGKNASFELQTCKSNFEVVVALDTKNIQQLQEKQWFGVDFDSKDMEQIIKVAQEDVEEYIKNNENIYKQSEESLREFLKNISKKFDIEIKFTE